MIEGKIVRLSMLNYFYQLIQDIFVLKETGKGLSTNDYTDAEKADVAKIAELVAEGGEPNTINVVKVNGTALTPDAQKAVNVTTPKYERFGYYNTEQETPGGFTLLSDDGTLETNVDITTTGFTIKHMDHNLAVTEVFPAKVIPDETRVQALIAAELADISGVDFVVVAANEELPETGVKGKFYLKATGATGSNKYDEYVWVNHGTAEEPNYGYEKIGTMAVDLTGYIKESDIQFATKADIDAIFSTNSGE